MKGKKQTKQKNEVHQRNQEEKQELIQEKEEIKDVVDKEKSTQQTQHVIQEPELFGIVYGESPTVSIVLHITFFLLLAIMFFTKQEQTPLIVISLFFYIGIQIEGIVGELPAIFKIQPVLRDINPTLKLWKEKWLEIKAEVSAYHYIQHNVHGQRRRGKRYTYEQSTILEYTRCEDVTEDISELLKRNWIFIVSGEVVFSYGNDKAQQEIEAKIKAAGDEGREKDKFSEESLSIALKDLDDQKPAFAFQKNNNIFINRFFFWVTSLLLLTIPYRLYVNSKTARIDFKIHKRIYM